MGGSVWSFIRALFREIFHPIYGNGMMMPLGKGTNMAAVKLALKSIRLIWFEQLGLFGENNIKQAAIC